MLEMELVIVPHYTDSHGVSLLIALVDRSSVGGYDKEYVSWGRTVRLLGGV